MDGWYGRRSGAPVYRLERDKAVVEAISMAPSDGHPIGCDVESRCIRDKRGRERGKSLSLAEG